MTTKPPLVAAIDTTSDVAGVALFDGENLLSELTWYSRMAHSRDLLPSLDWLLQRAGRDKSELAAIVACLGPGSYAGMRVGVSTAKALAYGLGAQLVGIGRLEADAMPYAGATDGRIVALQAAGRAELARAAYALDEAGNLREVEAPALIPADDLAQSLAATDLVCTDLPALSPAALEAIATSGARLMQTVPSRVIAVGRLGLQRLAAGQTDDPDSLAPLYLRAPAIGPQPPRD